MADIISIFYGYYPAANFYLLIIILMIVIYILFRRHIDFKKLTLFRNHSYDEIEAKLLAVDETVNAIFTIDTEGVIISANRAAEVLFCYEKKALNNNPSTILMPERFKTQHLAGLKRLREGGATKIIGQTIEVTGLKSTGEEFPMELTVKKVEYEGKTLYVGIIKDLTRRKAALDAAAAKLTELERKLKMFEMSEDAASSGAWHWDVLNKKVHISKQLSDMFGYPALISEIGDITTKVYHADQAIINEAIDKAFKGEPYKTQYRVVRPDFSVATIESLGKPYKNEDGIVTDIYGKARLIKIQTYEEVTK